MDLLQPWLVERIIDEGIAKSDLDLVRETGLIMIGVALIGMIGGVLCGVFAIRASQGFGADLRSSLSRKVQELTFSNLGRLETGSPITPLTNDVTQLTEVVAMLLRIMVRTRPAPRIVFPFICGKRRWVPEISPYHKISREPSVLEDSEVNVHECTDYPGTMTHPTASFHYSA